MAILRQLNVLGQQRLDVPHIRSIESSIAADFDVVAGRVQAGGKALVIRGFTLANFTAGTNATSIQLGTADGILYNMNSSEAGTFLWVPADRGVEVLNSATNPRVQGGFTAGQVNYIGLDLIRTADDTTSDLVQFLDPNTLLEQAKNVPLARTLDYRIVISTTPFSASPNIIPIAKVKTDNQNQVDTPTNAVEDARNIMWRLGSGGDFPDQYGAFTWPQNRLEYDPNVGALSTLDKFSGGDKGITSQKDWMDAVMMRLWELGGGQNWYSPTADRNIKMTKAPGVVFSSTGDNFEWVAGAYSSNHLHWQGLKIVFENANVTGVYYNVVQDQTNDDLAGSAALAKTALAIGDCLYVDLDRTSNATVTAKKAAIQTLGAPVVPGSRMILAWRDTSGEVYTRDNSFPVNTSFTPATPTSLGSVRLSRNYLGTLASPAGSNGSPIVISDRGGVIVAVSGSNHDGLSITGDGTGRGLYVLGGATGARGGHFEGTANFEGVYSRSLGTGWGIVGVGGTGAAGGRFEGGTGGGGLEAVGEGAGHGAHITAGATGTGLVVIASGGTGATVTSTGVGAGVQINKTGGGAGLDIQISGGTGIGLNLVGNTSSVSMSVFSTLNQPATFTGAPGDGFTFGGAQAALFLGGNAGSNPVAGSFSGGNGLVSTAGQGFGHNGTGFGGGPGGKAGVFTGGAGGDIIAGGTGPAGDGGYGLEVFGGRGGDNVSSAIGGAGGNGIWTKGGTGGLSTLGTDGVGGHGIYALGGNGVGTGSPGSGVYAVAGSGGTGNAHAVIAVGSGANAAYFTSLSSSWTGPGLWIDDTPRAGLASTAIRIQGSTGANTKRGILIDGYNGSSAIGLEVTLAGGSLSNAGRFATAGSGIALQVSSTSNSAIEVGSSGFFAIDVTAGNIRVPAGNSFQYASSRTRTLWVPLSTFLSNNNTAFYFAGSAGDRWWNNTAASGSISGGSVHLPPGAILQSVQLLIANGDASARNWNVILIARTQTGGGYTNTYLNSGGAGGAVVSVPASTTQWTNFPLVAFPQVPNNTTLVSGGSNGTLYFYITLPATTSPGQSNLDAVLVTYTYQEVNSTLI